MHYIWYQQNIQKKNFHSFEEKKKIALLFFSLLLAKNRMSTFRSIQTLNETENIQGNGGIDKKKPESQFELTIKEITGTEAPTRAAPSTAQGGTKNTPRRQPSGRAGWSRAADGPPPSSSAADISRYILQECGYSAAEHEHHIRTKTKASL